MAGLKLLGTAQITTERIRNILPGGGKLKRLLGFGLFHRHTENYHKKQYITQQCFHNLSPL
ncbi:Uncharacterized protein dnm_027800 [Desulfonema magnum]|uniref:Uncharacterized protein n=1 Tax=Desulfonema magnum TaxID=45655 RepID=A0A975GMC0_9BACT|nr:Uncharacterized protein dnm_027800 [Desulfonema magnum]